MDSTSRHEVKTSAFKKRIFKGVLPECLGKGWGGAVEHEGSIPAIFNSRYCHDSDRSAIPGDFDSRNGRNHHCDPSAIPGYFNSRNGHFSLGKCKFRSVLGRIPTVNVQVFIRKMQVLSFLRTDPALNIQVFIRKMQVLSGI